MRATRYACGHKSTWGTAMEMRQNCPSCQREAAERPQRDAETEMQRAVLALRALAIREQQTRTWQQEIAAIVADFE